MSIFKCENQELIQSDDGSYTAYSKEYAEHYHSTKDGALHESLYKHVYPAMKYTKQKVELHILDICYGLGFNTLATLWYHKEHALTSKIYIYSPEFDKELVESLVDFTYPKEFDFLKPIIQALSTEGSYRDEYYHIEVYFGDAREYIRGFENKFDIVYQDAFSPHSNPLLWTKEYFSDIKKTLKEDGILTTYSTALKTRLALYKLGFDIYLNKGEGYRNATLASLEKLSDFQEVDMEHKISCNPDVEPLSDLSFKLV